MFSLKLSTHGSTPLSIFLVKRSQSWRSSRFITSSTHDVFNQSSPFQDICVYSSDPALRSCISAFLEQSDNNVRQQSINLITQHGKSCGSKLLINHAKLAEKNRPSLRQFDEYGRRIDVAEYHSSYHTLMEVGISVGAGGLGFRDERKYSGAHVTRAALIYLQNFLEPGHCCPIVMTNAAIPVLRHVPSLAPLLEKLTSHRYDPRNIPMENKEGITVGMSMTEKQGGSDVRANTTIASPVPQDSPVFSNEDNQAFVLKGHKWFTSAPMCDAFLTLAKIDSSDPAPSCFFVPRWVPCDFLKPRSTHATAAEATAVKGEEERDKDKSAAGVRNTGFKVMRLKDKLGDRANASSEVEYDGAWALLIGERGKGVKQIMDMVQATRLDCALGSAASARKALALALNHASTRMVFGAKLIEQPLMRTLLTDLCVEAEAHTLTAMYMAKLYDIASSSSSSPSSISTACAAPGTVGVNNNRVFEYTTEEADALFRVGVAVSKYYITKRLPTFTYECMEVFGGNGYVEDFLLAQCYRQAPLNSIWEGSGNVLALDVLRAATLILPVLIGDMKRARARDPSGAFDVFVSEIERAINLSTAATTTAAAAGKGLQDGSFNVFEQRFGRFLVDRLAVALQASVLLRFGDFQVAGAYIATRLPPAPKTPHHASSSTIADDSSCSREEGKGCVDKDLRDLQLALGFGQNYGSTISLSEKTCSYILDRNAPVFV